MTLTAVFVVSQALPNVNNKRWRDFEEEKSLGSQVPFLLEVSKSPVLLHVACYSQKPAFVCHRTEDLGESPTIPFASPSFRRPGCTRELPAKLIPFRPFHADGFQSAGSFGGPVEGNYPR